MTPPVPEPRDTLEGALARAAQAEAMYEALVLQVPGITYAESLDDGRTISISPQVESLLGYSQEEWMNNPLLWVELIHPDDLKRVVDDCHAANEARRTFRAEYRMITRDGRVVWIDDVATLVEDSRGRPLCWQGVMLDVTDRKEAADS